MNEPKCRIVARKIHVLEFLLFLFVMMILFECAPLIRNWFDMVTSTSQSMETTESFNNNRIGLYRFRTDRTRATILAKGVFHAAALTGYYRSPSPDLGTT